MLRFNPGDHLFIPGQMAPYHEAIFLGTYNISQTAVPSITCEDPIIHLWTETKNPQDARVRIDSLSRVPNHEHAVKVIYQGDHVPIGKKWIKRSAFLPQVVIARALSEYRLQSTKWNLLGCNCGHFASDAKFGERISLQLERFWLTRTQNDIF